MGHSRRLNVAIVIGHSLDLIKEQAAAVAGEGQSRFGWCVELFPLDGNTLRELKIRPIDGMVAIGLHDDQAAMLAGLEERRLPTVHLGEAPVPGSACQIAIPNTAIGAAAAQHLVECGHRRFAYCGVDETYSRLRCKGFAETLERSGRGPALQFLYRPDVVPTQSLELRQFLAELPTPIGVMTCNDVAGVMLSRIAADLQIDIPGQLSILSVDDEELWCLLASPPLSSIQMPTRAIGRQAAKALHDLMSGQPAPSMAVSPALKVVERQSTAVFHADNPQIAAAIQFLRMHFVDGAAVHDAAEFAGISRSTLERGLRQTLGRSPFEELTRLRFEAAREMLTTTDLPIKTVANRCGFTDHRHLTKRFRAAFGMVPSQFRHQRN